MNNLIIDAAGEKIFLKIISNNKEYNIKHDNCRENFDNLVNLIFEFLNQNNIDLSKINNILINQGPGKYSSIRSVISIVKAIRVSKNIDIYGYYSSQITNNDYNNLINLLKEGRLTKNFIQPKYLN
tara:strand:+ start:127 stop:504 length:378 start_codon:yes stop_codon:yes gene_type:complete